MRSLHSSHYSRTSNPALSFLPIVACVLVVLGSKFWLISAFGSATPFWDQWDAEAVLLYKPYLEGTLRVGDLFAPHNEHRILFSRLIDLGLLELGGRWDPILQMVTNAVFHVAGIALLLVLLESSVRSAQAPILAFVAAMTLAVPFGNENILAGFQSQFYLLLLFTFGSLLLFRGAPALSVRWWVATALALASFFTGASGTLTLLAVAFVHGLQVVLGERPRGPEVAAVGIHLVLASFLLVWVLLVDASVPSQPRDTHQFVSNFLAAASWPLPSGLVPALFLNAPVLLTMGGLIKRRAGSGDPRWIGVTLVVWVLLQCLSLAYGRAGFVLSSRYNDMFVVGLIANFAALLYLLECTDWVKSRRFAAIAAAWIIVVICALVTEAIDRLPSEISSRHNTSEVQTTNVRRFLETGEFAHLASNPAPLIPYPSSERLRDLLSDATIRCILPPVLVAPCGDAPNLIFARHTRALTTFAKKALLGYGPMLLPIGVALLIIGFIMVASRRPTE